MEMSGEVGVAWHDEEREGELQSTAGHDEAELRSVPDRSWSPFGLAIRPAASASDHSRSAIGWPAI